MGFDRKIKNSIRLKLLNLATITMESVPLLVLGQGSFNLLLFFAQLNLNIFFLDGHKYFATKAILRPAVATEWSEINQPEGGPVGVPGS